MDFAIARRRMVERYVIGMGISDQRVIDAMVRIPRHLFVEEALRSQAYTDFALPIGERQTISQPHTVAFMTEALGLRGNEKVLEIGTGSGYQAAVLAALSCHVYTLERHVSLARKARQVIDQIGLGSRVHIRVGDGTLGWEELAPFDAIITTAGAPSVPEHYLRQLGVGSRLLIPVGDRLRQDLFRVTRRPTGGYLEEKLMECRFVPLVGAHGWKGEG